MAKTIRNPAVATGALKGPHFIAQAFNNMSIRTKLFTYAGVLIVLMLALAFFTRYQVYVIQNKQIPARSAARDMESALLSMRVSEQRFISETDSLNTELYIKGNSSSIDRWRESYQQFEAHQSTLLSGYKGTELESHLQIIQPQMIQYRDTFLALTSAYQQRGFQTFGRVGVLQQRAEALQTRLQGNTQAQVLLLKLRDAQNTFLLYKDASSITAFNDYAAQLRQQLGGTNDRITLEEYTRLFQEVVQLHQKIGLTAGEGLRGVLNGLVAKVTPEIQLVEQEVLIATNNRIAAISQLINVVTLLFGLTAIVMAILIARAIIRRVQLLVDASQRITAGDLDYRVPIGGADELGHLSTSFNSMTEKLQEGHKALRQRANDLSQSVKRFELVSRAVNEAIYEWDIEAGTIKWGDGLVTLFGYKQSDREATIDWWTDRIHVEDTEAIDASLNEHFRRHSSNWKSLYRFKKANGQYVYCQDRGFIEYRQGQPLRMVGSLVDITRQKELDRAKDEFISIASHQLRTPLGGIRWNLELVLDKIETFPEETADCLREAYKSTLRMLGLVGDLLSVARIEQGRVQDMPQQTSLASVIQFAVAEMKPIIQQKHMQIDTASVDSKRTEAVIDPKRFREVIQNLLSNAVKYSPSGSKVVISIQIHANEIVIGVADSGIGIPPEDHHRMFGKFFRAKNVTTTDTEGSGLGLFVVKNYVESWKGRIWFESQLNKGTVFYITVPRKPHIKKPKS